MDVRMNVGHVSDFTDQVARSFEVEGLRISVAAIGGRWYAFDDTCTHRQCSLADGSIEGTTAVCPCHGGTFDLETGEVLAGPPPEPIRIYRAGVEGDAVFVEVPERRAA